MADKADKQSTNQPEASAAKPAKRRLRAAPAASIREQSQRAQAKADKPNRLRQTGRVAGAPFRFIGRVLRPLGKFKPIRILGYIVAPPYIRNAWRELKLVTWPNRQQTRQLTFAVVVFSLIFGVVIAATDYGLDKLFRKVILKQ